MAMKYRVAIDPTLGRLAIMASESGGNLPFNVPAEFPVASFSSAAVDFPLNTKKLAENIADLLNHRAPLHILPADGRQVFYTRTDDGIVFKTRQDGQAGVSVPAVTITVSSKSSVADLGHNMLARMDADFMKRVCDVIVPDSAATIQMQHNSREHSNKSLQI